MLTIWKFPLQPGFNKIVMPTGAELLDVQMQMAQPALWARVDDAAPKVQRGIVVCGTGHEAPQGRYVATFQMDWMVWHAFDHGETPIESLGVRESK